MPRLKNWISNTTDKIEKWPVYSAPLAFLALVALYFIAQSIKIRNRIERMISNEIDATL